MQTLFDGKQKGGSTIYTPPSFIYTPPPFKENLFVSNFNTFFASSTLQASLPSLQAIVYLPSQLSEIFCLSLLSNHTTFKKIWIPTPRINESTKKYWIFFLLFGKKNSSVCESFTFQHLFRYLTDMKMSLPLLFLLHAFIKPPVQ